MGRIGYHRERARIWRLRVRRAFGDFDVREFAPDSRIVETK